MTIHGIERNPHIHSSHLGRLRSSLCLSLEADFDATDRLLGSTGVAGDEEDTVVFCKLGVGRFACFACNVFDYFIAKRCVRIRNPTS